MAGSFTRALIVISIMVLPVIFVSDVSSPIVANLNMNNIFYDYLDGYQLTAWDYYAGMLAFACDNNVYIVNTKNGNIIWNSTFSSMIYSLRFIEFGGTKLFIGFGKSWFISKYKPMEEITLYGPVFRSIGNESYGFAIYDPYSDSIKVRFEDAVPVYFDVIDNMLFVGLSNGILKVYSDQLNLEYSIYVAYDEGIILNYKVYSVDYSDGTRYLIIASGVDYLYGYGLWLYLCPPPEYTRTFSVMAFVDANFSVSQYLYLSALYISIPYWWLGFAYDVAFDGDSILVATEYNVYEVFYNSTSGRWEYNVYYPTNVVMYTRYMYGFAIRDDYDGDSREEYLFVTSVDVRWYHSEIFIWDDKNSFLIANYSFPVYDVRLISDDTAIILTNDSILVADFANYSLNVKASTRIPVNSFATKYLWMIPYTPPMRIYFESSDEAIIIIADAWNIVYARVDISSKENLVSSLKTNLHVFRCIPNSLYRYGYYLPEIRNTSGYLQLEMGFDNFILFNNNLTYYRYARNSFVYGSTQYSLWANNTTIIIHERNLITNAYFEFYLKPKQNLSEYEVLFLVAGRLDVDFDDKDDLVAIVLLLSYYLEVNDTMMIIIDSTRYGLEVSYINMTDNLSDVYRMYPLDILFYSDEESYVDIIGFEGVLRIKVVNGKPVDVRYIKFSGSYIPLYQYTQRHAIIANLMNASRMYWRVIVYNIETANYSEFKEVYDYSVRGDTIILVSIGKTVLITPNKEETLGILAISADILRNEVYLLSRDGKIIVASSQETIELNLTNPLDARIVVLGEALVVFEPYIDHYKAIIYEPIYQQILAEKILDGVLLGFYRIGQRVLLFLRNNIVEVSLEVYIVDTFPLYHFLVAIFITIVTLAILVKVIRTKKQSIQ